ncbi:hypothetical protein F7725_012262 [Dissostichus mawsoni]|uniref:HAT C-terminal dimerisation domain-containing protein n=1 Tax=Dissostichus mawsoni TaxID=36200 RepID=A0A7J5YM89_DISMA|nr:hypothetical protein F7725_012262 [Dissostichus mawsoni]
MTHKLNDAGKRFNISMTESELSVFLQHVERKRARGGEVFPCVNGFLNALITLPMTSCTAERVFSSVKRIKTACRSTMLTPRLQSLCLLTFERDVAVTLDYDEVIDIFKSKPCRPLSKTLKKTIIDYKSTCGTAKIVINREFMRITTVPLTSKFLSQLDECSDQLVKVFINKGGAAGKEIRSTIAVMNKQ